jgi:uncharacterized membrane protein
MKSTTPLCEITAAARAGMSGRWGTAIGVMLVYNLLLQGANLLPDAGRLLVLLYAGPMMVGVSSFFLAVFNGAPRFSRLFDGFDCFAKSLGAYLLTVLFVMLWMLLFIVPGIIKSYSYAMTFFILADDPAVGAAEAITRSRQIMNGNKWRLFCLYIRFIGWGVLCLFTLGLGFLWLVPYMAASSAAFYVDIKDNGGSGVSGLPSRGADSSMFPL